MSIKLTYGQMEDLLASSYRVGVYCRLSKEDDDITELDAETLNHLVRKIVVHEEIEQDGTRDISLEIHYNFRPTDESKTYNLSEYAEEHSVPMAI